MKISRPCSSDVHPGAGLSAARRRPVRRIPARRSSPPTRTWCPIDTAQLPHCLRGGLPSRVAFWSRTACRCRRRTCSGKLRSRCSGRNPLSVDDLHSINLDLVPHYTREKIFESSEANRQDGLGLAHGAGPGRVLSISPGKMRLGSISSFGRMRRAVSFRKKSSRREKSARTSRYTACGRPGGLDLTAKTSGNS